MDSQTGAISSAPQWHDHDPALMARDFLLWRHLRVIRARTMRHVRQLVGPSDRAVETVYGVKMWPSWSDRTFAYCHYGTYGNYLSDLIHSISSPFCFIDIGANQGLFSLIAAQNSACAKVIAMEPVPDTFAKLSANFELNGLADKGLPINSALSDHAGSQSITLAKAHSGMATLGNHLSPVEHETHLEKVDLITIKELDEQIPEDLPLFVKVDVEGHEQTVIEQLMQSRHSHNLIGIFYEFDARWSDAKGIDTALASGDFSKHRIYGRGKHYDVLATPG